MGGSVRIPGGWDSGIVRARWACKIGTEVPAAGHDVEAGNPAIAYGSRPLTVIAGRLDPGDGRRRQAEARGGPLSDRERRLI